jgi:type 1 glutamine amidotransferase
MISFRHLPSILATAAFLYAAPQAWAQSAADYGNYATYTKPAQQGQNPTGIHVYLYGGLKSHGPGEHDYPQWLADWSKVLTEHGAVVDGSFHFPSAERLAHTDVLIIYKGDAAYLAPQERADLQAYVKRGGGIVTFHDSLCGPDPADFASIVGGAKKHGEVNYTLGAPITYKVADPSSPIIAGLNLDGLTLYDEAFYKMTWANNPQIHVIATNTIPDTPSAVTGGGVGQTVPQIWTYEHTLPGGQPARAFVWMQGHTYANFANPAIQTMILRGIAWADHQPLTVLTDYKAPPRRPRMQQQGAPAQ